MGGDVRDPRIIDPIARDLLKQLRADLDESETLRRQIISDLLEAEKEIVRLRALLRERDGGDHELDCKSQYGDESRCNCLHNAVRDYFAELAALEER